MHDITKINDKYLKLGQRKFFKKAQKPFFWEFDWFSLFLPKTTGLKFLLLK